ncbi:hypothetical protein [Bacillus cereus]|uniref:hypothetical protein n=1 Tax=Bacillus cereus TaxID=1396 RepID=UPI000B7F1F7C|nr:hypothetical protein [Bacillus cereus]
MTSFVITSLIAILALIIFTLLRFMDLGMNFFEALRCMVILPATVGKIYVEVIVDVKKENGKVPLKTLFFPVTKFPQIIIIIADVFISRKALLLAAKELLAEVDEKKRSTLIKELRKEGIRVKRKKIKPKRQAKSNVEIASTKIYGLIIHGHGHVRDAH